MEGESEKQVCAPRDTDNSSKDMQSLRTELIEGASNVPDDPYRSWSQKDTIPSCSVCKEIVAVGTAANQELSKNGHHCEKQDESKGRKGKVVMQGKDFCVEVDPCYESGGESDTEMEAEVDHEKSVSEEVTDFTPDRMDASLHRQVQSPCSTPSHSCSSGKAAEMKDLSLERDMEDSSRDTWAGAIPTTASGGEICDDRSEATATAHFPARRQETVACSDCGKTFAHDSLLRRHMSALHSDKCVPCSDQCVSCSDQAFGDLNSAVRSERTCSECGKTFSQREVLRRHFATVHMREQNFTCSECGKKFSYQHSLNVHVETIHRGNKRFSCPQCNLKFATSSNLKVHLQVVHEGLRKHSCEECGRKFGTNGTLKTHIDTVHKHVRRFACEECDVRFSQACNLTDHVRVVHRGERNFICFECGNVFGHKSAMKIHVDTVHKGIKRHSCTECGKKFSLGCALKTHMRTVHQGEKNFTCNECGRSYGQKGYLKTHINTVHGKEKRFACAVCGKKYAQSGSLRAHCKTHTEK